MTYPTQGYSIEKSRATETESETEMTPQGIKVAEVHVDGKARAIFTGVLGTHYFIADRDEPNAGIKAGDQHPVVMLGEELADTEAVQGEFIGPRYLPWYLR